MELKAEEQNILTKIYGKRFGNETTYVPNRIVEVLELTADEEKFFNKENFVSPFFSVQTLYKVNFYISPMKFNRAVLSMIAEDKNFRTNYCKVGSRTVKVVFADHSGTHSNALPEIVYKNLSDLEGEDLDDALTKIMEADRRNNFNLEDDHLFRFSVFKTAESECAVLFTALRLISENFNSKNFFAALVSNRAYQKNEDESVSFQIERVEKYVQDYWTKILSDLPPTKPFPYFKINNSDYYETIFRSKIPADIASDLRGKAKSNRAMLMSILQSAWGFLLQAMENVDDVAFCQLVASVKGSGNSALNIIPVRMKSGESSSVEKIVNEQFKQMMISKPYSFFDWHSLQEMTGEGQIFDHFLSFLDFNSNQKSYSQEEATFAGTIVAKNSWDSQGMKLGVYFQYANSNLTLSFIYDAHSFIARVGERWAQIYNLILRQMLVYWHADFKVFIENVAKKIVLEIQAAQSANVEDDNKIILNFISANPIFHGETGGTLRLFSKKAKLFRLFEGDRIESELMANNLIFVVEGKLARTLDTGDGWFNALDIISKDGWLNETILLPKQRAKISAEVLTEQATIMTISYADMNGILKTSPQVTRTFMNHILKQMEKYQILWLQS